MDYISHCRSRRKGLTELLGIKIDCIEDGHSVISMDVKEEFLNPWGVAHGGTTYSIMDTAAGISAQYKDGKFRPLVSQSGNIHYLRPIFPGVIRAESFIIKDGSHTAVAEVKVYNCEGEICASGEFDLFFTGEAQIL